MSIVTGLLSALFPPRREVIADLIPGRRALVRGTVVARDFIDSTLTAERCVYYRYAVEEWRNTHMAGLASDGYWAHTRFDEAIVEFYLQDEDGARLIVSPQNASVERGRGVQPQAVDMGVMGQRARELRICPGDLVEVQGTVARVSDLFDQDRDYRGNASRLMLYASPNDSLSIHILDPGC
ncbi:MAG: hypothetical protein GY811_23865 [Myxococcales bacterium]|nr:hypothetical protein [Myxococcales bacterium]